MNFPSVEFSWFGNGNIIAIIAIIHVLISHGIAIGTTAVAVSLEMRAHKRRNEKLDQLAKKMTKWILIITTTMGAMTGIGIWFSTSVIQPDSISSLLRIFFWAWVVEWAVFITEVILLIIYYYTWDKWKDTAQKRKHINLGLWLIFFSWLTMAIITGVLAAKLTPGLWTTTFTFWNAFLNPTYLPSLGFRMFLAVTLAIGLTSFIIRLRVKDQELRGEVYRVYGMWGAITLPMMFITGLWYIWSIPQKAYDQIVWATGMPINVFQTMNVLAFTILIVFLVWLVRKPKTVPWFLSLAVMISSIGFIGEFEVVRESVRKPYIIYDYMYANGALASNTEKYNTEGYLANSAWSTVKEVTVDNQLEAGRNMYVGQCLSCHTVDGWRSKRAYTTRVKGVFTEETLAAYMPSMHTVRVSMPPVMGTQEEIKALAAYIMYEVNKVDGATAKEEKKSGDEVSKK